MFGDEEIGGLGSGPRYPETEHCDCCKREQVAELVDAGICDDCYATCSASFCAVTDARRGRS